MDHKLEYNIFNRLPTWSQVETLTKEGTALVQRKHHNWEITLYSLHNYFVELWTKDGLEIIGSFYQAANPMAILEPYTDHIEIQNFLEL